MSITEGNRKDNNRSTRTSHTTRPSGSPEQSAGSRARPPRPDPLAEGTEPRPVTAATAHRCGLGEKGTLVFEGPCGSHEIGPVDESLSAESIPPHPHVKGRKFNFRAEQTLTFIPPEPPAREDGPEDGMESPPVDVQRARNELRVEPDTASRYTGIYRLLSAADCRPERIEEDLDALTWTLVYASITAAKKAERIVCEANGLLAA